MDSDLIGRCVYIIHRNHNNIGMDVSKKIVTIFPMQNIVRDIYAYKYVEQFDFGLFEAIIPYLSVHDILVLFMTSKYLRVLLCNRVLIKNTFDLDTILIDMVDHKCTRCRASDFGIFGSDGLELNSHLFMVVCKKMDIIKMDTHYNFRNICMDHDKMENYIHECVLYATVRDYIDRINLFTYISKTFTINNIETIKIICENIPQIGADSCIIIDYITKRIRCPSNEMIKLLLPYLCIHHLIGYFIWISCNFENSTDNYEYLLNLISDNQHIYSREVISMLLEILIEEQNINSSDVLHLIKLTCKYGNEILVLKFSNLLAYHFDKNYSEKDFLQTIINTIDTLVKSNLILFINNNCRLNNFTQEMSEIINWVIHYDKYNEKIVTKLISLKYLDTDLKLLLLSIAYEYCNNDMLEFLNENAKLNEISITMAINSDSDKSIYCSHLNNNQLFNYIVIATSHNKYDIRKKLILSIETCDLNLFSIFKNADSVFNEVDVIYYQKQNILPIHYIYNETAYMYKDNKVICKYKLKSTIAPVLKIDIDRILKIDYVKPLVENNPDNYYKIFDKIMSEVRRLRRKGPFYHGSDVIKFTINHEKINQLPLIDIINILLLFVNAVEICDDIITNYNFFQRFTG